MFRKIDESKRISTLRDAIKHSEDLSAKHSKVAGMPSSDVIPVINQILLDLQLRMQSPRAHKHTSETITKLLAHFGLRGELMTQSYMGALKRMYSIHKEEVYAELDSLKKGLGHIKITGETSALWSELSVWLEGLYQRTYNRIPKESDGISPVRDKDGNFPTVDYTDSAIKRVTGMTKMALCEYYHGASLNLAKCLDQARQNKHKTPYNLFLAKEMDATVSAEEMARSTFGQSRR